MKLRWWIIGTFAVMAGGVLAIKHLLEVKNDKVGFTVENEERNISEVSAGISASDTDELDFSGLSG
jgi:hypothetical protein